MFTVVIKTNRNGSLRVGQIHSAECPKCGHGAKFATYAEAATHALTLNAAPIPELCITPNNH